MNKNIDKYISGIEKYLRRIDYTIRVEGRKIINELNITIPQFTALQILIHNGDLSIGELSQKMGLACSTITDLIDRMEKSDLVSRKKDQRDKRVVIVEALPKGHEILEKVLDKRRIYIKSKLSDFSEKDIENLHLGLERLYDKIIED